LVQAVAAASVLQRLAGQAPIFTPGKAREFLHRDWGVAPQELAPGAPPARFDLSRGLAHTADWYREVGWLPKFL
jgi:hypothetical protein